MSERIDATPSPEPKPAGGSVRGKGIIAVVAGTALLLGGTGTYAYWSTQQALTADDIVSGDLNLALGEGTWTLDGVLGDPFPVTDLAAVNIVPGDVLTLQQDVDVTLVGETIEADLTIDLTDVVPAAAAGNFTVTFATGGIGEQTGTNTFRLDPADITGPLETTVVITFAGPGTTGRQAVDTALDLSAIDFSLTQASS